MPLDLFYCLFCDRVILLIMQTKGAAWYKHITHTFSCVVSLTDNYWAYNLCVTFTLIPQDVNIKE